MLCITEPSTRVGSLASILRAPIDTQIPHGLAGVSTRVHVLPLEAAKLSDLRHISASAHASSLLHPKTATGLT
jgi:hypothetical protein